MALILSSPAFTDGGNLPARYTCQGEDISPALAWKGAPGATRSFAVILEDPDAPGGLFSHWILFNLPGSSASVAEGASPPAGAGEGKNDFGRAGYGGPCPPPGKAHHYVFRLYALSDRLTLKPGASRAQAESARKGLVLEEARLTALFQRS